jgi:hypothetical protein
LIASSRFSSPAFYQQMQAYLDKLQVTTNPILSLSLSLSNLKKKKERKKESRWQKEFKVLYSSTQN